MDLRIGQTPRSIPSGNPLRTDLSSNIPTASFDDSPTSRNHFMISGPTHTGSQDPSSENRQSIDLTGEHSSSSRRPNQDVWTHLNTRTLSGNVDSRDETINSRNPTTPNRSIHSYHRHSGPGTFNDSAYGTLSGFSQDESLSVMTSEFDGMENLDQYFLSSHPEPEEVRPAPDPDHHQLEAEGQPATAPARAKKQPKSQRQPRRREALVCVLCGAAQKTPSDLR